MKKKDGSKIRLLLLIATCLLALPLCVHAALAAGGSISGTVVDNEHNPIASVEVQIYNPNMVDSISTAADGSYTVSNLPPAGTYKVYFDTGAANSLYGFDYPCKWYNDKPNFDSADQVIVAEGFTTGGINAQLDPPGSISGTVTDNANNPLSGVLAEIFDSDHLLAGSDYTDTNGDYHVTGLLAGSFRAYFTPPVSGNKIAEWYNNKTEFFLADQIPVSAGQTTGGISVQLADVPATTTTTTAVDDYGDSCATAFAVSLNSTVSGTISSGTDYDFFSLQVPALGMLRLYTTGALDTMGSLKNSACTEIDKNDDIDTGSNNNFRITKTVPAGTYFLSINKYEDAVPGPYTLHAEFILETSSTTTVMCGGCGTPPCETTTTTPLSTTTTQLTTTTSVAPTTSSVVTTTTTAAVTTTTQPTTTTSALSTTTSSSDNTTSSSSTTAPVDPSTTTTSVAPTTSSVVTTTTTAAVTTTTQPTTTTSAPVDPSTTTTSVAPTTSSIVTTTTTAAVTTTIQLLTTSSVGITTSTSSTTAPVEPSTTTTTGASTTTAQPSTTTTAAQPTTTSTVEPGQCPATMILGADHPGLKYLRALRDNSLLRTAVGRKLISIYYDNENSINAALESNSLLKAVTRRMVEKIASLAGTANQDAEF